MVLSFKTDDTGVGNGFTATYISMVSPCPAGQVFGGYTGDITDGSGTNNYFNWLECSWLINPSYDSDVVSLQFTSFDTQQVGSRPAYSPFSLPVSHSHILSNRILIT